jgi:predicted nuclease of predicted toxin-antitoxin system
VKIVLDMNLSPEWTGFLISNGLDAVHWSSVGRADAKDSEIMAWARDQGRAVFTHDLDFGIALALSRDGGPSVIQIRSQNITPSHLGGIVVDVLRSHADKIVQGALVTIDEAKARVRILPLF